MKTDFLDLWMVHDVRTPRDLEQIFGPDGAIKPLKVPARTNWSDSLASRTSKPGVLSRALDLFPFDTILLPVNPAEPHYWSFLSDVLPKAQKKGMGILE